MNDLTSALAECHRVQDDTEEGEVSDGCARTIASMYHDGSREALSFVSTGAFESATTLWRTLFGNGEYDRMPKDERILADMLGTYLLNREDAGPVEGWFSLWVR